MMVLQNSTNSENVLVGPYGEIYPASHDANQTMNIKAEEVSDAQDEVDPLRIAIQEIKAEPKVSCMFLYVHCYADITKMRNTDFISPSLCLSGCAHEATPLCF
jgi:hypothetical protein